MEDYLKDRDNNEKEYSKIAECKIKNRSFIITVDKKILEKSKEGIYKECIETDTVTEILKRYTQTPKSLDVER